ncbi:efflux RND transporter periplasmic adaptor subunit [Nevskia sp.]|uniref:efflux RND transporter periplasmic adaptor subunit n=1 Tax=Nevskia sp. TaxID=1929292 RepID=UPI0025CC6225|nr:efflux RND transporter periplasmic adaptor subunit [Nevskia sp.]
MIHSLGRALLAVSAALLLAACSQDPKPVAAPVAQHFDVATEVVLRRELPAVYTSTGSVVSDERVDITSRLAAYVRSIEVREGERVQRGQRLATLDSKDVDANIRAALANRDQAAALTKDAEKDLETSESLFAGGVVTTTHVRKTRLQLQAATESLAAAEAVLVRGQAERQYTSILSPVAGVVIARQGRVGTVAAPGVPLVTVESDTALLFATQVAEQRVAGVHVGDPVKITIDALGQTLTGEVLRVVSSGSAVTRGFEVKIAIPATPGLTPGMFGRSEFQVGQRPEIAIPPAALVDRGGLSGVYVVDADDRLHFRWLRTGHQVGDAQVVLAGLDEGERIVSAPTSRMREGDRITAAAGPSR